MILNIGFYDFCTFTKYRAQAMAMLFVGHTVLPDAEERLHLQRIDGHDWYFVGCGNGRYLLVSEPVGD